MATPTNKDSDNGLKTKKKKKENLDDAFRLIEEGHELKKKAEHWAASRIYAEAAQLLETLSRRAAAAKPQPHNDIIPAARDQHAAEQAKIAALYHHKALEYLRAARLSLVAALEHDAATDHDEVDVVVLPPPPPTTAPAGAIRNKKDSHNNDHHKEDDHHHHNDDEDEGDSAAHLSDLSALLQNLTDDDCYGRLELFGRLFAKEQKALLSSSLPGDTTTTTGTTTTTMNQPPNHNNNNKSSSVDEETSKLEDRLLQLNSSIPRSLKTEAEKIRDLNSGLRRLGLSTVGDPTPRPMAPSTSLFLDDLAPPKSESEQIAEIINQARDEVNLGATVAGKTTTTTTTTTGRPQLGAANHNGDDETDPLDDDDSVSSGAADGEEDEDDANLTTETCRSIYETLLAAHVSLAELVALFEVDDGGTAEIEFDPARGRHLLRDLATAVRSVRRQWHNNGANGGGK